MEKLSTQRLMRTLFLQNITTIVSMEEHDAYSTQAHRTGSRHDSKLSLFTDGHQVPLSLGLDILQLCFDLKKKKKKTT